MNIEKLPDTSSGYKLEFGVTADKYSEAVVALNAIKHHWRNTMVRAREGQIGTVMEKLEGEEGRNLHTKITDEITKKDEENKVESSDSSEPKKTGPYPIVMEGMSQSDVDYLHTVLDDYVKETVTDIVPTLSMGIAGLGQAYGRGVEASIALEMKRAMSGHVENAKPIAEKLIGFQ